MGDTEAPAECWCSVYPEDDDGDPFGAVFPHPIEDDVSCNGKTVRYVRADISDAYQDKAEEWQARAEAAEKSLADLQHWVICEECMGSSADCGTCGGAGAHAKLSAEPVRHVPSGSAIATAARRCMINGFDSASVRILEQAVVAFEAENCPACEEKKMPPALPGIADAVKRDVAEALRASTTDQEHTEWAKALLAVAERLEQ